MPSGKRNHTFKGSAASTPTFRNLKKEQIGGVIFGCTNNTIDECLAEQIFGLPGLHIQYVRNIDPGLPLFLFNYSKRVLHGVFEAASCGQMNINPYGWTTGGSQRTGYPAQVQIRIRTNCHPLSEKQFRPIIEENYYSPTHFKFELDYAQVSKLITLFSSQVVTAAPTSSIVRKEVNWQMKLPAKLKIQEDGGSNPPTHGKVSNGHLSVTDPSSCHDGINGVHQSIVADSEEMEGDEAKRIYEKLQELAVSSGLTDLSSQGQDVNHVGEVQDVKDGYKEHAVGNGLQKAAEEDCIKESAMSQSDLPSIIAQLMQEVQELKAFKQEHIHRMIQLEQKVIETQLECDRLKNRCMVLESLTNIEAPDYSTVTESCGEQHLDATDLIYLAGGYNGTSWLSSLDSYSPSLDILKSLRPMSSVRSYSSIAKLNGEFYVIGGGNSSLWYDTVESYNPLKNEWTSAPCLNQKKGSLAAATLHDKIFAIGGGNGVDCFADVEMLDLDVGRWISARSMQQKRFALAAVELNGAVYAVGGYDGKDYLRSAERFDHRDHSWSRLESMSTKRGCHSLVVLNEKLYAVGGFDGSAMVSSVEVFDPRKGSWMIEAPMKHSRGYASAVVLSNNLYVVGGVEDDENIVDQVERYEEGCGWQITNLRGIGKRCFASAIVL